MQHITIVQSLVTCVETGARLLPEEVFIVTRVDTQRCEVVSRQHVEPRVPLDERKNSHFQPTPDDMGLDFHEYSTDECGKPVPGMFVFSISGRKAHTMIGSVFAWFNG